MFSKLSLIQLEHQNSLVKCLHGSVNNSRSVVVQRLCIAIQHRHSCSLGGCPSIETVARESGFEFIFLIK